jgi:hypothetical protein
MIAFTVFLALVLIGAFIQQYANVIAFREHMDIMSRAYADKQLQLLHMEQRQKETVKYLNELIANNRKIIKDNEIVLFHTKESSILLYDQYDTLADLLSNIMPEQEENEIIGAMQYDLDICEENMEKITDFFLKHFKMTPQEYKDLKVKEKITFKQVMKKPNGEDFESEFSLN